MEFLSDVVLLQSFDQILSFFRCINGGCCEIVVKWLRLLLRRRNESLTVVFLRGFR